MEREGIYFYQKKGEKAPIKRENEKGVALFAYTLSHLVRMKGLEPVRLAALDPKSSAYTNSATSACLKIEVQRYIKELRMELFFCLNSLQILRLPALSADRLRSSQ
jgi:hypothetical protein